MDLNYKKLGQGQPVIILHGIFGTLDNWQTFAKKLASHYEVYLVDQRNHGFSPHHEKFDIPTLADDLYNFINQHNIENPVLIGHSLGGKVVMHFSQMYPENFDKGIVVDIAPKYYPPHHQKIIEAYESVDLGSISGRKEAEEQMSQVIDNKAIRQFLLKNLYRNADDRFSWKLNLPAIKNNIEKIGDVSLENRPVEKPFLFVYGEKSDYIKQEDHELILTLFPKALIEGVSGSGHWIHAEKPDPLYEVITHYLDNH